MYENLMAGEDYSALRNVVVIFITTYDPFGRDRMVYTIKNGCILVDFRCRIRRGAILLMERKI